MTTDNRQQHGFRTSYYKQVNMPRSASIILNSLKVLDLLCNNKFYLI